MVKVAHLTSVHSADDVRIFHKECRSLAQNGFVVHLVAPGCESSCIGGVQIHGVPKVGTGRLKRMTSTVRSVYHKALAINADLYHLHDPELLPVGLLLKMRGKKVVFDMHENVVAQIRNKIWIPKVLRYGVSLLYQVFQVMLLWAFDSVVLAESCYNDIWLPGCNSVNIRNYPILLEFQYLANGSVVKDTAICYLGGITILRGAKEMVIAANTARVKLLLAGQCDAEVLADLSSLTGWNNVEFYGMVGRDIVSTILSRSVAGLVVLHPAKNYIETEPTKMFEYMAAGIPVIASNFPTWERIVKDNKCGFCVDPMNPESIASAIRWVLDHAAEANEMGQNGLKAVREKYNWEQESKKLISLYNSLVDRCQIPSERG